MSDFTYVENVAHAFICAEEALCSRTVSMSGKAFFITNLEPIKLWDFISLILEGLGYKRPMIKLPAKLARPIVPLVKWMHAKMESKKFNHPATAHNFIQLALWTRTFNCSAAQEQLGYSPVVSLEDGVKFTVESFSHLARDSSFAQNIDFDEYSKVDELLGNGKVADILLWRDEKKTFTCFVALVLLYYWFFFSGMTFISSLAKLLLLSTVALSGSRILPSNVFGFSIQEISLCSFEISELDVTNLVRKFTSGWNRLVDIARTLAQGEDWNLFLKVAISLYFLKFTFDNYFTEAIGVGLVLAFTAFFVYEQYEEAIDGISKVLLIVITDVTRLLIDSLPSSLTSFLSSSETWQENKRTAKDRQ